MAKNNDTALTAKHNKDGKLANIDERANPLHGEGSIAGAGEGNVSGAGTGSVAGAGVGTIAGAGDGSVAGAGEGNGTPMRHSLDDIRQRMRNRHADGNYDNDDDLYDALYQEMDDDDMRREDLARLQQREDEFNNVIMMNPRAGDFFVAVSEGKSPVAMLVEAMGTDAVRDYLDDESNAKEMAEAQQKYLDEVKKGKEFREQYEKNVKKSLEGDDKAVTDGVLSEEDIDRAHESLEKKVNDYIMGKWSVEDLKGELRSLDYDQAVADARQQGEIRGRNEQITSKLRRREQGDGIPSSTRGGGRMPQRGEGYGNDIFSMAAGART